MTTEVAQAAIVGDTRSAQTAFRQLGSQATRLNSAVGALTSGWTAMAGSLVGVALAFDRVMEHAVEVTNVSKGLKISVDKAAEAVGHQTTKLKLAAQANALMATGMIETEEQYAKMVGIVAALADAQGKDLDRSIEKVVRGFQRGSDGALRQLSVMVSLEDEARELGRSLTLVEKRQIMVNALMENGAKVAGEHGVAVDGAAQKWVAFKNSLTDWTDAALDTAMGSGTLATEQQKLTFEVVEGAARANILGQTLFALADAYDAVTDALDDTTLAMRTGKIVAKAKAEAYKDAKQRADNLTESIRVGTTAAFEDQTAAIERNLKLLEAQGASEAELDRAERQLADTRAALATSTGDLGKAEEIRFNEQLRRIKRQTAQDKKTRGGKGGKDPQQAAREAAEAEKQRIAAEQQGIQNLIDARVRESEVYSRTAEDRMAIIEEELERRQVVLALRREQILAEDPQTEADRLAQRNAVRQVDHEQQIAIMEAEAQKREEVLRRREIAEERNRELAEEAVRAEQAAARERIEAQRQMAAAVTSSYGSIVQVMRSFAEASGEVSRKEAIAVAIGEGMATMAVGAATIAEGATNVASQNYIKGVPQIITGAAAVVTGGLLMAGRIQEAANQAGSGRGGGRGMIEASGQPTESGAPEARSGDDVPVSPVDEDMNRPRPTSAQNGAQRQGGVTITGGTYIGADPEQLALALRKAEKDGGRINGRLVS